MKICYTIPQDLTSYMATYLNLIIIEKEFITSDDIQKAIESYNSMVTE